MKTNIYKVTAQKNCRINHKTTTSVRIPAFKVTATTSENAERIARNLLLSEPAITYLGAPFESASYDICCELS